MSALNPPVWSVAFNGHGQATLVDGPHLTPEDEENYTGFKLVPMIPYALVRPARREHDEFEPSGPTDAAIDAASDVLGLTRDEFRDLFPGETVKERATALRMAMMAGQRAALDTRLEWLAGDIDRYATP